MDPQTYQYFDYEAGGDDEEITGEKTPSSPPKDPMTIYARLAAKLEMKEEQAKVEARHNFRRRKPRRFISMQRPVQRKDSQKYR